MPKKSNLELALDEQVKSLGKAQQEMIKKSGNIYRRNDRRINDIVSILDIGIYEGEPLSDAKRDKLDNERHKLVMENNSLYSHINRALKDTDLPEQDELGEFCFGK